MHPSHECDRKAPFLPLSKSATVRMCVVPVMDIFVSHAAAPGVQFPPTDQFFLFGSVLMFPLVSCCHERHRVS